MARRTTRRLAPARILPLIAALTSATAAHAAPDRRDAALARYVDEVTAAIVAAASGEPVEARWWGGGEPVGWIAETPPETVVQLAALGDAPEVVATVLELEAIGDGGGASTYVRAHAVVFPGGPEARRVRWFGATVRGGETYVTPTAGLAEHAPALAGAVERTIEGLADPDCPLPTPTDDEIAGLPPVLADLLATARPEIAVACYSVREAGDVRWQPRVDDVTVLIRAGDRYAGLRSGFAGADGQVVLSRVRFRAVDEPDPLPPAPPEPAPGDRYALVWHNAPFRTAPALDAPMVRAHDWPDAERPARPGQVYLLRVFAEAGPFVGVSAHVITTTLSNCAYSSPHDAAYRLKLWVHRDDLAPALTRLVVAAAGDGTSARLHPGVPVVDGGVVIEQMVVPVDLPDDAVGTLYLPERLREDGADDDDRGTAVLLPVSVPLAFDGRPVVVAPHAIPGRDDDERYLLELADTDDGRTLLGHEGICGALVLSAPAAAVDAEASAVGLGGLGARPGAVRPWAIPAGSALYWPDGARAGTLAERREFTAAAVIDAGARRCVELPFGHYWVYAGEGPPRPWAPLRVCVDATDLVPSD